MRITVLILFVIVLSMAQIKLAFAYIDPGLGSLFFQGLLGAIAVIGGVWYSFKAKIKELINKIFQK